jgi:hypothetical protein
MTPEFRLTQQASHRLPGNRRPMLLCRHAGARPVALDASGLGAQFRVLFFSPEVARCLAESL